MTKKRIQSASLKWSALRPTPEILQAPLLASADPNRMLAFTPIPGHLDNVG